MAINLGSLQQASTTSAAIGNLALAIPLLNPNQSVQNTIGYQPQSGQNSLTSLTGALSGIASNGVAGLSSFLSPLPPALIFNYEGEQSVSIKSDITDHWVETNSSIQDQIGLHPEIVVTHGYIGEVNDILPLPLQLLQTALNSLILMSAYTPQLSQTALLKYNSAVTSYEQASSAGTSAIAAIGSITSAFGFGGGQELGKPGSGVFQEGSRYTQSHQQQMFSSLYGYWYNRVLFNIQTPWAVFTNMAIQEIKAIQDEKSLLISDFQVTFKKIRTASTQTSPFSFLSDGRAATQSADPTNIGTQAGANSSSQGSAIAGV